MKLVEIAKNQYKKIGYFDEDGNFIVLANVITLVGGPQSVGRDFYCGYTNITSLEGAPQSVGGNFSCSSTDITSLEGAPSFVGSNFYCALTKITSLHNIHKQIKHIGGRFVANGTPIQTSILGLFFIDGLQEVDFSGFRIEDIINKYLPSKDVHMCQEELIDAGFPQLARL